jgi:hypothetical protein
MESLCHKRGKTYDLAQGLCFINKSTVSELEEKYDLSRGMVPGMLLGTQTAEKSQ